MQFVSLADLYAVHTRLSGACLAADWNHDLLLFNAVRIRSCIISSKIISLFIAISNPILGCLFIPVSYCCLLKQLNRGCIKLLAFNLRISGENNFLNAKQR